MKKQYKFNDFDHFAEMISKIAFVEHYQLDCGNFSGKLDQIICGPVIIHKHRMNRKILQNGIGAPGYTNFLLTDFMKHDMYWRKKKLNGNILGILKENMEHSCVTPIDFSAISISIEDNFLQNLANSLGYQNFFQTIKNKETFPIDEKDVLKIRQMVNNLSYYEITDTEIVSHYLSELIIRSIVSRGQNVQLKVRSNRGKFFEKAKEHIFSNYDKSLSVSSLCKEIGTSERNLRYAFNEYTGLSPKTFMINYKLNIVRKLMSSGESETVADASNKVGFWHTGKFAADYRMLFGEFPSGTIKKVSG